MGCFLDSLPEVSKIHSNPEKLARHLTHQYDEKCNILNRNKTKQKKKQLPEFVCFVDLGFINFSA